MRSAARGSVLIEVLVALTLLAFLVVPLAGGILSAGDRTSDVQRQTDHLVRPGFAETAAASWTWGPKVQNAWWRPGPILHIQADQSVERAVVVGLWVDGWYQTEAALDQNGVVKVPSELWAEHEGKQLLLRVQGPEDAWGPPWRLVVPDASGRAAEQVPGTAVGFEISEAVVHVPTASLPHLVLYRGGREAEIGPSGLPLVVAPLPSGMCTLGLDGRVQSWISENSHEFDVYY